MRRLPAEVRVKAIEIANAMLAAGCDEGQAIRVAIAAARKWACGAKDLLAAQRRDADARRARVSGSAHAGARER